MLKTLTIPAFILASACSALAQSNLLVNGSFENPSINGWSTYDSIQGWTAESFSIDGQTEYNPIEVGNGGIYGVSGFDGNNIAELNSNGRSKISQTISGLSAGEQLNLSFLAGMRGDGSTNKIEVLWNDQAVGTYSPTSSVMSLDSLNVTALAGTNKLSFESVGNESSIGGVIDNAKLQAVPEPAPFAAMGVGLGCLGLARRRKPARG
jgi:hypothetical protein